MTIGERIKNKRKERNISADSLAELLGVSRSTVFRYENSSIEKIPVHVFDRLCEILEVTPEELRGDEVIKADPVELPTEFHDAQAAMEFIIKTPMLAAYGGYDPSGMSEETIVAFANEILQQLKLVSYKYKSPDGWR